MRSVWSVLTVAGMALATATLLSAGPAEAAQGVCKASYARIAVAVGSGIDKNSNGYVCQNTTKPTKFADDRPLKGSQAQLSVKKSGSGGGSVTGPDINCGADCSDLFALGDSVTLTATPNSSSQFIKWGGACRGVTATTCTVTVTKKTSVTATFAAAALRKLTVSIAGSGSGKIVGASGINCGFNCSEDFASGSVVRLTGVPADGSAVTGWTNCVPVARHPDQCDVTMDASKGVTATFSQAFPFVVTRAGSGAGTVTATANTVGLENNDIDCGADCRDTYLDNTIVTLIATPAATTLPVVWSGGCTVDPGNANKCVTTVKAAVAVTATFDKPLLTVTKNGTGTGAVKSVVAGIDCGTDCAERYDLNEATVVTLKATPDPGLVFTEWGGACAGTPATADCVVTMSEHRTVSATFTKYQLTITIVGTGSVTVDGQTCTSGTCIFTFATPVVLATPTPGIGNGIVWSGACAGSVPCALDLTEPKSATATFAPLP